MVQCVYTGVGCVVKDALSVDVVEQRRAGMELRGDEPSTTDERTQVPDDYWSDNHGWVSEIFGGWWWGEVGDLWSSWVSDSVRGGLRRENKTSGLLSTIKDDPFLEWLLGVASWMPKTS